MISLLFIMLGLAVAQSNSAAGTIEGRVVRFGTTEGLPNVEITLSVGTSANPRLSPETISDADGRFILRNLLPGTYTIRAVRGGYVNPSPNGVRLRDGGTTASVVVSEGQPVNKVNLSMVRGAVIAGTIVDESGQPFRNAEIRASPISPGEGTAVTTTTNDRGEYRLFGLESGRYRVRQGAGTGETLAGSATPSYFPGVPDPAQATILTIADGEVLTAVDFGIQPRARTFKVSGRLISPSGTLGNVRITNLYLVPWNNRTPQLTPQPSNGGLLATARYNRADSGNANEQAFEFGEVRSGSYDLFISTGNRSASADCCDITGRVALDVVGQDVQDLQIFSGGRDVFGRFVHKDMHPGGIEGTISLALVPEDVRTREVRAEADGEFRIPNVLPGTWRVLTSLPSDVAVFDVRQGERSNAGENIDVGGSAADPIQVVLSPAGQIDGVVHDAQQRPLAASYVFLMPQSPNASMIALYRRVRTDAAGKFTLTSVAAGTYSIVAVDSQSAEAVPASSTAWPGFFAAYPNWPPALTVVSGETTSAEFLALKESR